MLASTQALAEGAPDGLPLRLLVAQTLVAESKIFPPLWTASSRGLPTSGKVMSPDIKRALELAFPSEDARYFSPISIGNTPASADEGAAAILEGTKTTTSSPLWDWPDGRIPFVGALSVLLDGQSRMRAIIETERVEIISFGAVDESLAWSYGEGDRTLHGWRSMTGTVYRESAARHETSFLDDTPLIFE
jgi:uncharacterized protein YhfF